MIVISDTTAISNLLIIQQLHLLEQIFGEIIIPTAVFQELSQLSSPHQFDSLDWSWISVQSATQQSEVDQLLSHLDLGEAEAIILAEELQADLLIIDESKGRSVAESRGISFTGLLGVLIDAKDQGLIPEVTPLMDQLIQKAGFWISASLYRLVQDQAGE